MKKPRQNRHSLCRIFLHFSRNGNIAAYHHGAFMVIVAKPSVLAGKASCFIIACRFSYHRMVELHCLSAFGFGKNSFGRSRRNAQLFHMPCHYKTAYNKRNLTAFCEAVKPAGILSAVAHKRIFSAFIRIGIDLESVTLRVVSP